MAGDCSTPCFIAVHVGAGYHSTAKESEYASAMHEALRRACAALQQGSTADMAVTRAIMALEVRTPSEAPSQFRYSTLVFCPSRTLVSGDS